MAPSTERANAAATPAATGRVPDRYAAARRIFNRARTAALVVLVLAGGAAPGSAAAESTRIVMLGDSITAGSGLATGDALPARLEAALRARGHAVEVIAAGVSGDTTAGGLARLDWALADRPDVVIVALGANDMLRGLAPAASEASLDAIIGRLKARNIRVLLAGMRAPANMGRAYGRAFNAIYPRLAEKHGVALYPFLLDGVALEPGLNQGDGIHPNARGVAVIVDRIAPYVVRLLESRGSG